MRNFRVESAPSEGKLHKVNIIGSLVGLDSTELEELKTIIDKTLTTMRAIERSPALRSAK